MIKKVMIKKNVVRPKISKPINPNKILIENFASLQKVMTNLSIKFDNLANQISKLLSLFEISAKALAEKEFHLEKGDKDSRKMMEKIDNLLEQNKTIARGLTLIHEREEEPQLPPTQRFAPPHPQNSFQKQTHEEEGMNEFQESISSRRKR